MYAGRIVEEGPSELLFGSPAHPYTKALAAAFPQIGDDRFRRAPSGLPGDPPDPAAVPSGCPFHPRCPEAIDVCSRDDPDLLPLAMAASRRAACVRIDRSGAPEMVP
jgi:peptide/nickel transport system ATP-binding protein